MCASSLPCLQYARARSRVAKSLGLDAPIVAPRERAARQRKVVRYDFDDYDRHMRVSDMSCLCFKLWCWWWLLQATAWQGLGTLTNHPVCQLPCQPPSCHVHT